VNHEGIRDLCSQATLLLVSAEDDWYRLLEVEDTLCLLVAELAEAKADPSVGSIGTNNRWRADADLQALRICLIWVDNHRYDAMETELRSQLDSALRFARSALALLEPPERARKPA
jgi:hypothetical protein